MNFQLCILGCSSAVPTAERGLSAQWLEIHHKHYLLDCGEGTQIRIRQEGLPMQRLSVIFISHAHADHFLGLPGLLSTMDLLGRKKSLRIVCPESVKEFLVHYWNTVDYQPGYPIEIDVEAWKEGGLILEEDSVQVEAISLKHALPCRGFIFREQRDAFVLDKEKIKQYELSNTQLKELKQGNSVQLSNGTLLDANQVGSIGPAGRSYAYLTDTRPVLQTLLKIPAPNVLYHEATFTEKHKERAKKTQHSTASEAAEIAEKWGVSSLILGHFSVRYPNLEELLLEAQSLFKNTQIAYNGLRIEL
ncbi:MAG: ribonuclease Z [Bacteroidetes bacterium]|nr:ribonuclease Z [Bacteroidota bacterium]